MVPRLGHTQSPASNRLPRKRRAAPLHRRLTVETLEDRTLLTGTWSGLANLAPAGTGTLMLLSDGTVMVQGPDNGTTNTWYKLTPNSSGSYVNWTWSSRASMHVSRLYYGSVVLPDGRVFVVGGEYASDQSFSRSSEIYDPVANTWTTEANFPQSQFGDDPTEVLPDGRVLGGYVNGPQTYFYNPATNAWSAAGTKLNNDQSDEETWVKLPASTSLPMGGILTYDIFSLGNAQVYNIATNAWTATGAAPNNLSSSGVGYELGPAFRLPDGRVFFIGATGQTAYYTPSTNSWAQGPVVPNGLGADDAPGAELPNGKILFAADRPLFNGPTSVFEFDPTNNTYTNVTPSISGFSTSSSSYFGRMLVLPTGQVLYTTGGAKLAIYTPDGTAVAAGKPTISSINVNTDGSYTLTGTLLNGIDEGACYGDDALMASNYPIVQLTDGSGHVSYARTYAWSSTGVATGSTPVSTRFTLPSGITSGHYCLAVIANGIASNATGFDYDQPSDPGFELPHLGTGSGAYQYSPSGSPWAFANGGGVAGNGSDFTAGNPNAPQGTQVAFLQGYGTASQAVTFAAGTYSISVSAAQRGTYNASSQTFQVLIDGNPVATIVPVDTNYDTYATTSFTVTAGAHTITFAGTDPDGQDNAVFLDQVRVNTVLALSDPGFELPHLGTGSGAYQYNPSGSPWMFNYGAGVAGNGSDFTAGNPDAPQGTQVGFFQGLGTASQAVTFAAGTYSISVSAAQRGNGNFSTQTFQVLIDGNVVDTIIPVDTNYDTYTTASFTVTAGVHTITFAGIDPDGQDNTVFLDQVTLNSLGTTASDGGNGPSAPGTGPANPTGTTISTGVAGSANESISGSFGTALDGRLERSGDQAAIDALFVQLPGGPAAETPARVVHPILALTPEESILGATPWRALTTE
jgi:hypothetical protein